MWTIKESNIRYSVCTIQNLPSLGREIRILGIDPGKNFGVAIIGKGMTEVLNGILDDSKMPLRDIAFYLVKELLRLYAPDEVVIEGASYGDRFGQVKLAEVRCGFAVGASDDGLPVTIVAPKTPRKTVFGHGDIVAMNEFPTLNHNAADALCLALYPFYK